MSEQELPPFPVDDVTLDALDHALGSVLTYEDTEPGEGPRRINGEYGLHELLKFLSGAGDEGYISGYEGDIPIKVMDDPCYHSNDVIKALVTEVRRLRGRAS